MALVHPFHALRPNPQAAAAVAAVPYDVVSISEARALAEGNPLSFLRVSRAEIDLDEDVDAYDPLVYQRASTNLDALRAAAPYIVEDTPALYFYRLEVGSHQQTGLAGCFSLDEYDRGIIKRHERTRRDKEDDRTRHMLALGAQTGVVFLTHRESTDVTTIRDRVCQETPLYDFTATEGVRHTVWRVAERDVRKLVDAFGRIPALYIADGHHRIASAARVRDELAGANRQDPEAEACFVLGVAFPDTETRILPYNRTLSDLAGLSPDALLDALRDRFPVHADAEPAPTKGQVSVYLERRWYSVDLTVSRATESETDVAGQLDVARLQHGILGPLLNVADVRTDPRIAFVGGARATQALTEAVDSGNAAVAFSLAPVTSDELLSVSDTGEIMPPKSTWFEPKLRDGLLIHLI